MNFGASAQETDRSAQSIWAVKLLLCICAAITLLFTASIAQAQTVTRYTNSTDSTAGQITNGNFSCAANNYFTRNIVVSDTYIVSDVDFGFMYSHTWRSDVEVLLRSPSGTERQMMNNSGANYDNWNVVLDDSAANSIDGQTNQPAVNASSTLDQTSRWRPDQALSAFNGEQANGTWTVRICDDGGHNRAGTFYQADIFLSDTPPNADLSLTKTVNNNSPANGSNIIYTLTVTNSTASTLAANSVTVTDNLPAGVIFASASGTGTYNSGTGVWSVGTVPVGQSRSINITATVNATSGAMIINSAEIASSSAADLDSTPGNNSTNEDDDDTATFTVSGARVAGTPPNFNAICPLANQIVFDWNGKSWPVNSLNNSYSVTGLGSVNYAVSTDIAFVSGSPTLNTTNTGGFGTTQESLFLNMNNILRSDASTTVVTLPTAVPGLQFHLFDVDFGTGTNGWADKVTVTGTYNGATVLPTLTNNIANYVVGNTVIGDGSSSGDMVNGNVIVTFMSPVDTVTFVYGNHTTAPTNPGNQFMNIYDFRYCQPETTLSVTKISQVISDPISGTTNPKAIPGATMQYCILISNAGSATVTSVAATDNIPGSVTYTAASMRSGGNCGSAATVEDDNATGADESDPYGASISGATLTATAASLGPAAAFALTFQVTVD